VSHDSETILAPQIPVIIEPSTQPPSSAPAATAPEPTEPTPEPEPQPAPEPLATEPPVPPAAVPEPVPEYKPASAPQFAPTPVPAPAPEPIIITRENPVNEELYAKYKMALEQIERLKAQIAELSTPAAQELRRRTRKFSDADSETGSDVQTVVEEVPLQQEGVPLQIVVVIALGVFVTTYLFF